MPRLQNGAVDGAEVVRSGMTVDVQYLDDDEILTVTIEQDEHAVDPHSIVISADAPLARALLGARAAEVCQVTVDGHRSDVRVVGMRSA